MIDAIFVKELPNRFLCQIYVDNKIEECFVSSSSRLSNFIDLTNRRILVERNQDTNRRTQYTLVAACIGDSWCYLDLNRINNLFYRHLIGIHTNYEIKREKIVEGYKTDFYYPSIAKAIEIKSVVADSTVVNYPLISNGRSTRQLKEINKLLKKGYSVDYRFILLNPLIEQLNVSTSEKDYLRYFKKCITNGMDIKIYSVDYFNGSFSISESKCKLNY